jgi:hypothetical protein
VVLIAHCGSISAEWLGSTIQSEMFDYVVCTLSGVPPDYPGVSRGVTRGTPGYAGGPEGYAGVSRGTAGLPGVLQGSPGYAGVPRGMPEYLGVPQDTRVARGIPEYPGVPRSTLGYPAVARGPLGTERNRASRINNVTKSLRVDQNQIRDMIAAANSALISNPGSARSRAARDIFDVSLVVRSVADFSWICLSLQTPESPGVHPPA